MVLLNPAGLRLLLVGPVSWAAAARLADVFERRGVSLVVCVAGGTEDKTEREVNQHGKCTETKKERNRMKEGGSSVAA